MTTPRGLVTEYVYDLAGREVETRESHEDTLQPIITRRGYDEAGRQIWSQTPLQKAAGKFTTHKYDLAAPATRLEYGRLLRTNFLDDNADPATAPSGSMFEEYGYDEKGRQNRVTKPVQRRAGLQELVTTLTKFNDDNQAVEVVMNAKDGATSPTQNVKFLFRYDAKGNRDQVTYPSGITKSWTSNYDADTDSDLDSHVETQPGGMHWKTTTYNDKGLQDRIDDAVGNAIIFDYNDDSSLKSKTLQSAVSAAYSARHEYIYDDFGRLKTINTKTLPGELTRSESREYDDETGRVSKVSSPEGTIDYTYDFGGSLASMAYFGHLVSYTYDFAGRLSRAVAPEAEWDYTYNAAGQKTRVTTNPTGEGANLQEVWEYDPLGRVEKITHTRDGDANNPIFEIDYILGVDGQRIGAIETRGAEVVTWNYEYDPLGRLTRETRVAPAPTPKRDVSYTYDSDSNRASMNDHEEPENTRYYVYQPLPTQPPNLPEGQIARSQRLHQIKNTAGEVVETFDWTHNGEMKSRTEGGTVETYEWGPAGTLQKFSRAEAGVKTAEVDYTYDETGQRIGERTQQFSNGGMISDESRSHLVDDENLTGYSQTLALVDKQTGAARNIYSIADRVTIHSNVTNDSSADHTSLILTDALGSTRVEASPQPDVPSNNYDYNACGDLISSTQPSAFLAFTGQWKQEESSLQYHRARWLNITNSRWLSCDNVLDYPYGFANAYLYAGANSQRISDISGSYSLVDIVITAALISGLFSIFINGLRNLVRTGSFATFFDNWHSAFLIGAAAGAAGALLVYGFFALIMSAYTTGGVLVGMTAGSAMFQASLLTFIIVFFPLSLVLTAMSWQNSPTEEAADFELALGIVMMLLTIAGLFALGRNASISRGAGATEEPPAPPPAVEQPPARVPTTFEEIYTNPEVLAKHTYNPKPVFDNLIKAEPFVEGKGGYKLLPSGRGSTSGGGIGYDPNVPAGVKLQKFDARNRPMSFTLRWHPRGGHHKVAYWNIVRDTPNGTISTDITYPGEIMFQP